MKNIRLIINEELKSKRKEHLTESFTMLSEIDDIDTRLLEFFKVANNLIAEGYDNEEIDKILSEQGTGVMDYIGKGFNALTNDRRDDSYKGGNGSWGDMIGGGLGSMVKEKIIRYVLTQLGIKGKLVDSLAVGLVDVEFKNFLKLFKNVQMCIPAGANIADSIMEVLVFNAFENMKGDLGGSIGTLLSDTSRNVIGDMIASSTMGEVISTKFCRDVIWKENNPVTQQMNKRLTK